MILTSQSQFTTYCNVYLKIDVTEFCDGSLNHSTLR